MAAFAAWPLSLSVSPLRPCPHSRVARQPVSPLPSPAAADSVRQRGEKEAEHLRPVVLSEEEVKDDSRFVSVLALVVRVWGGGGGWEGGGGPAATVGLAVDKIRPQL